MHTSSLELMEKQAEEVAGRWYDGIAASTSETVASDDMGKDRT